jgi:hypothetical protein
MALEQLGRPPQAQLQGVLVRRHPFVPAERIGTGAAAALER